MCFHKNADFATQTTKVSLKPTGFHFISSNLQNSQCHILIQKLSTSEVQMGGAVDCCSSTKQKQLPLKINIDSDPHIDGVMCGSERHYQVKQEEISHKLHKFIVAIVWKDKLNSSKPVSRGSGILISPNLILSCAHNFYHKKERVQDDCFTIYPLQSGELKRSYKIEQVYIPKQYQEQSSNKSTIYDYALIKITQKFSSQNFIPLAVNFNIKGQKIAIFGYPAQKYPKNDNISNMQTVDQWGLVKQNCVLEIRQERGQILHCISTLPGQSGSPILWVQDLTLEKFSIVGIHKGGLKTTERGKDVIVNAGNLITGQLLVILLEESLKMKADRFVIQGKEAIAKSLAQKGDMWAAGKEKNPKKALQYYLNCLKIHPDLGAYTNLKPFIRQLANKQLFIEYYRNELKLKQSSFNANLILGLLFQEMGDEQSENQYKNKATQANGSFQIGWNILGLYYQKKKDYYEFISCNKKAVQIDSEYSTGFYNLGVGYSFFNKFDEAIRCYQRVIQINPQYSSAYYNLGVIYQQTRQVQKAIVNYRQSIQINPVDSNCYFNLGKILYSINKIDESIDCYKAAIKIKPEENTYNSLGLAMVAKGRINDAIQVYRKALQLNPLNSNVHCNLGKALRSVKKVHDSISQFRQAIEANPQNTDAYFHLGSILSDTHKTDQAIDCFVKAIKQDSGYLRAYYSLGSALMKRNKVNQAIQWWLKTLFLAPDSSDNYLMVAKLLKTAEKVDLAIKSCKKAIFINPINSEAYNKLGGFLQNKSKIDLSIKCYRKSIKINPFTSHAYTKLAKAYEKMNKLQSAATRLNKSVQIDPSSGQAKANLQKTLQVQYHKRNKVPKQILNRISEEQNDEQSMFQK